MFQAERLLTGVANQLRDLFAAWWRHDRIRVSPREGWLLRQRPACWISIRGELVRVVGRTVGQTGRGAYIEYECESDRGASRLSIELAAGGESPRLVWEHDGRSRTIGEDEVRAGP
jgi:hypothetical protein